MTWAVFRLPVLHTRTKNWEIFTLDDLVVKSSGNWVYFLACNLYLISQKDLLIHREGGKKSLRQFLTKVETILAELLHLTIA